ncbi:hypothetical protein BDV30DRAFT_238329 [Aspergillus minisclerotigenes]|uniref:Uncharacterized protein n=1 Tax=Aspergillus minisclerotigenes TaxID=656917 RepID=A0A5N6J741_9EURO|nr:hypothetical protein BDV30DRAFT_238329 [Aspergillus minisclerotigenes]
MDPKFAKEVLENQATIPKEKTYTKKDVLEDDGVLRDGVVAVLKNSSEQGHRAVVTVLVVHRDANNKVCRVEEIDLNTDEQERLRKVGADQYETWTYDWEFPESGIDASNALDTITLYKTTNIVTKEPCKSRLDRPKSTVYLMKVLVHIIKTLGHTGQYIYVLPYVYIRPSSTQITLAVKKGMMEELLHTMKWICLTFRPLPDQPCFSFGLEDKDRKTFSLKLLLALDETKGTSLCCRRLFGNAVIACEEWSDKLSDCSFFMDMPFSDMKTRTKCETLKEVSGGITLAGPNAILVPIRYTPDHRAIIWFYEEGDREGDEHMNRALGQTGIPTRWLGPEFKQSNLKFEELVGDMRALVYTGTDIPKLGAAYSLLNTANK